MILNNKLRKPWKQSNFTNHNNIVTLWYVHESTEQYYFSSFQAEISPHLLAAPMTSWFTGVTELRGQSTSFWTISGFPNSVEKSFGNVAFWRKATAFATVWPVTVTLYYISTKWLEWRSICTAQPNLPNSVSTMAITVAGLPTGPYRSSRALPGPSTSSVTSWIRQELDFRHSTSDCSNQNLEKCLSILKNLKFAFFSLQCY